MSSALGVRYGVASRWVSEDPQARVVPVPTTLVQIAELLDIDVYDAFRHAGYLPRVNQDGSGLPHEAEMQALMRRFRRILRAIPPSQWAVAAVVMGVQLDQLQILLARLEELAANS